MIKPFILIVAPRVLRILDLLEKLIFGLHRVAHCFVYHKPDGIIMMASSAKMQESHTGMFTSLTVLFSFWKCAFDF